MALAAFLKGRLDRLRNIIAWLSEQSHRRALAAIIAWIVVHELGQEIDSDTANMALDLLFSAILAAWAATPKKEAA